MPDVWFALAVTSKGIKSIDPYLLYATQCSQCPTRDNDDVLERVFADFPQSTAQNSFNLSSGDTRPTIIRRPFNLSSNYSRISKCQQEADDRIGQDRHGFV